MARLRKQRTSDVRLNQSVDPMERRKWEDDLLGQLLVAVQFNAQAVGGAAEGVDKSRRVRYIVEINQGGDCS